MKIRVGYELIYDFPQPTPMIMVLGTHFTRASDVIVPDYLTTDPSVPISPYRDASAIGAAASSRPPAACACPATASCATAACRTWSPRRRPSTRSRICRPRRWSFSSAAATARPTACPTWPGSCSARRRRAGRASRRSATSSTTTSPSATSTRAPTKTAWEAFNEGKGVCRDYAHLAITFCRCMNIPARYCTGYLGDIGMPPPYGPMDFAGWFEAYLGGRWYTFDRAQQHAAHRPRPDRPRPRCRRRADHPHLRPQHAGQLQGLDGRGRLAAGRLIARAARSTGTPRHT